MNYKHITARAIIIALALIVFQSQVGHCELEIIATPYLKLRECYDDNIYYTKKTDLEHRIIPGLKVDITGEKGEMHLKAEGRIYRYAHENEFDREEQFYSLQSAYWLSEKARVGFDGGYTMDFATDTEVEEGGDAKFLTWRRNHYVKPYTQIILDERNSLDFSYTYDQTQYELRRHVGIESQTVSAGWNRAATERLTTHVLMNGIYSYHDFEEGNGYKGTFQALGGVSYLLNENSDFSLYAGWDRSVTNIAIPAQPKGEDTRYASGFIMTAELNAQLDDWTYLMLANERFSATALDGTGQNKVRYIGEIKRQTSAKTLAYLKAIYTEITSGGGNLGRRKVTDIIDIIPLFKYQFHEDHYVQFWYHYQKRMNVINHTSRDRSRFFIELVLTFPEEL